MTDARVNAYLTPPPLSIAVVADIATALHARPAMMDVAADVFLTIKLSMGVRVMARLALLASMDIRGDASLTEATGAVMPALIRAVRMATEITAGVA